MEKLPNYQKAFINESKLAGYALNADHPTGGHKARRFIAAMGIDASHADDIAAQIMDKLPGSEAIKGIHDKHGQRYSVDMELTGPKGKAIVRTAWIVDADGEPPRFISFYVKES